MEYPLPVELESFNYHEDRAIVSVFLIYDAKRLGIGLKKNFEVLNSTDPHRYPKPPEYLEKTNALMHRLWELLNKPTYATYLRLILLDLE